MGAGERGGMNWERQTESEGSSILQLSLIFGNQWVFHLPVIK
jgi:hypothetical protein